MKLSDLSINELVPIILGETNISPKKSGPNMIDYFNRVGFRDIYKFGEGGLPDAMSRKEYVRDRLTKLNGKKELKDFLSQVFDNRNFVNTSFDHDKCIKKVNAIISHDNHSFQESNGIFQLISSDSPDDIGIEAHFEDIQNQIIQGLRGARYITWVAVAWLTDDILINELISCRNRGISVRVIVMNDDINMRKYKEYCDYLEVKLINSKGHFNNIMHHKFCVIDLRKVIHGSYNWTTKAKWNKESITVTEGRDHAEMFADTFIRLFK